MNNTKNPIKLTKPAHLELYRQTLVLLFRYTLYILAIIGIPLIGLEIAQQLGYPAGELPILALVALAGALGALFSALTRLYSLHQLPSAILLAGSETQHGKYLKVFCLVPPVVGSIGAIFFYILIASEIISSNIFQQFHCIDKNGCEGLNGLLSYSPVESKDYAKSIVWGFVAGFSERLVPDTLANLDNDKKDKR